VVHEFWLRPATDLKKIDSEPHRRIVKVVNAFIRHLRQASRLDEDV
jgi:hypothetical protein